jgi:hypothetical protein
VFVVGAVWPNVLVPKRPPVVADPVDVAPNMPAVGCCALVPKVSNQKTKGIVTEELVNFANNYRLIKKPLQKLFPQIDHLCFVWW